MAAKAANKVPMLKLSQTAADKSQSENKVKKGYPSNERHQRSQKRPLDQESGNPSEGRRRKTRSIDHESVSLKKTKDHLRELCKRYELTKCSKELISECKKICGKIRRLKYVVDVFPAFHNDDHTHVIFVVTHTGENINTNIESIFKGHEEIDYFAKSTHPSKCGTGTNSGDLRKEEEERLQRFIRENSKRLFEKHRYLNFIQGCTSDLKDENNEYKPRLAFYVPAKGYIPIDEDPFENSYDNIPVDVREGVFFQLCERATEVHDHVRMGCQIQRKTRPGKILSGTLGVFVRHPFYGLCGITCAHVLVSDDEIRSCQENNGEMLFLDSVKDNIVYQPKCPDDIGTLRKAFVKATVNNKPGLEIAVIQINKRTPKTGQFPASQQTEETGLEFTSGRALVDPKYNGMCFKFGRTTNYTEGEIVNTLPNALRKYNMQNHIQVRSFNNEPFADDGDSGGPVFIHDDGEVVCIGIIEGIIDDIALVTPISSILDQIGVSQLVPFQPTNAKILREIKSFKRDLKLI